MDGKERWSIELDVFSKWFAGLSHEKQLEVAEKVGGLLDYSARKTEQWLDRVKFSELMEREFGGGE